MITVKDLSVIYPNGHRAIHDVNFQLQSGNTCALVGVNGSGKSTLFNAVMGIVPPQTGEILIDGKPIEKALKNNLIAYVPQSDSIDYHFPILVKDVVMLGRYGHMNWRRKPQVVDFEKVQLAMERLNISNLAERQIGELSGGQRKRVFLARALAQESRIILLDEPFTGVDVQTEHAVMQLLKELRAEGFLMLVSTHNLGAVPLYCNEVIFLNRTVLNHGEVEKIYTAENLERAFGGALKNIGFGSINIVTDDERPAIFVQEDGA